MSLFPLETLCEQSGLWNFIRTASTCISRSSPIYWDRAGAHSKRFSVFLTSTRTRIASFFRGLCAFFTWFITDANCKLPLLFFSSFFCVICLLFLMFGVWELELVEIPLVFLKRWFKESRTARLKVDEESCWYTCRHLRPNSPSLSQTEKFLFFSLHLLAGETVGPDVSAIRLASSVLCTSHTSLLFSIEIISIFLRQNKKKTNQKGSWNGWLSSSSFHLFLFNFN